MYSGGRDFSLEIRTFLKGSPIVFLNACHTVCVDNPLLNEETSSYAMGSGNALDWPRPSAWAMKRGRPKPLSARFSGTTTPGPRDFAIETYQALLEGASIGEALRVSRRKIFSSSDVTWASYVLYGDPRLNLPQFQKKEESGETGGEPAPAPVRRTICPKSRLNLNPLPGLRKSNWKCWITPPSRRFSKQCRKPADHPARCLSPPISFWAWRP